MPILETLTEIKERWINRVSYQLARGEGVRESFRQQLLRFYELLQQSAETGDPAWLIPILNEWAASRTETELEKRESSLYPLLNQILLESLYIASENLSPDQNVEFINFLLPVFIYASEYVVSKETELHITYISKELDKAHVALEHLDESKSDFIAVAAHELRTPLTLIEGYAAMLREMLVDSSQNPKVDLFLKGMGNGTRRLREIVDDMIDVSLIDNDMLSLNFQPVWLNQLFGIIKNELQESIINRRQTIDIEKYPGSDEMIYADAERLYQALRNVVSNAVKYTPDGGKIDISGRKLPGFLEITVHDNGIGISPENHTRIFEKFGRLGNISLHSSGKTKFKGGGPGLGLPIARGIIEAHGGTIWVESPGYDEINCPGSTFHILIPIRKDPPDLKTAKLFNPLQTTFTEDQIVSTYAIENS
jgi:signal transduction histidine kinase